MPAATRSPAARSHNAFDRRVVIKAYVQAEVKGADPSRSLSRTDARVEATLADPSLRSAASRFVLPGGLCRGALREARVHVLLERDLLVEDARFDHQVAHHVEVGLARREARIDHAVERFRQGVTEDFRLLAIVVARHEIRRVLAVRAAFVEPQARARDA